MLKINYNPSLYVFTCNIPSEIEISSDAASVYVTIACGPDTIFETTLYPYNNIAMLYDARSIIEGHMLDKQRVFANFVITADTKTEETTTPERHFIYSRLSLTTNAMGLRTVVLPHHTLDVHHSTQFVSDSFGVLLA